MEHVFGNPISAPWEAFKHAETTTFENLQSELQSLEISICETYQILKFKRDIGE
jgi:hypothetical protein